MRLLHWASVALFSLASAEIGDSNLTHASRNILPSTFTPPKHWRNVNLVRNINLEKSYAKETLNVVIENVDKEAQREYFLPFEQGTLGRTGGLEVRDKKDTEREGFRTEVVEVDPMGSTEYYKITLPTALAPKDQLTLSITYYALANLNPLPASIAQTDKQYVLYTFSAYAPSAYTTLKQKTKLKLPTTDVPDALVLPKELNAEGKEDPQKQGTSYTYGPYSELEAGAVQETSVRYEFTKPLTHGSLLERDIEVSHWGGNLAIEERHWLLNRGAALKNHFSRVAYQQSAYYNPPTSALKEMTFPLTAGSADAYFTDDIGNVSTSRFRSNFREANLELKPRYPLFGGWKYSFRVGWNEELKTHLRSAKGKTDSYILRIPFFEGPKQSEGISYSRVVTRVILPEGASNIAFSTPASLNVISNTTALHKTFMDTLGRTTLTLTALNLVDEQRGEKGELLVTYDYPGSAMYRKPVTIVVGFVVLFVVSWVVGSLDVRIGKGEEKRA